MTHSAKVPVSFEMFPPKNFGGFQKLEKTCHTLQVANPNFFSITFGAAGSSQEKTRVAVERLIKNNFATAPHISCVGMTPERLTLLLENYRFLGINRLVVVRGDPGGDLPISEDFPFAAELISFIRKLTGNYFHIIAAAYPEFHPQASDSDADLLNLKRKTEAGANTAITQFFFNSDAYFRFRESCDKIKIAIPIIPGILPIYSYRKLLDISASCGAEIPLWLRKRLERFADDPASLTSLGIEIVTKLCESLTRGGAEAIHFYTLNQSTTVSKICFNLGIMP
jgi:methylenetetrahydrofolate reductase (NADPH)